MRWQDASSPADQKLAGTAEGAAETGAGLAEESSTHIPVQMPFTHQSGSWSSSGSPAGHAHPSRRRQLQTVQLHKGAPCCSLAA